MKIAVTGAAGLLGWHSAAHVHARNCTARYRDGTEPFELVIIDRATFENGGKLASAVSGADAVLHFAGINRGPEKAVENGNPAIATALVKALEETGTRPFIVHANSTHAGSETPYGRSKRWAAEILKAGAAGFTDMILPHIFGECARPDYNNVTATLIDRLWNGGAVDVNPRGAVDLLHAGDVAELALEAAIAAQDKVLTPAGRHISIPDLHARLQVFHDSYRCNIFPDLSDSFDLKLFNSYRTAAYPSHYPRPLTINRDHRGMLFESAKGGNASHTFLSTTLPGKTRGDHFHLGLVERFLVVQGEAIIRIRKVLTSEVREFRVTGEHPVAIDQIPLHTHSIENVGDGELTTFFWSHRMFDPADPDTYADPVLS